MSRVLKIAFNYKEIKQVKEIAESLDLKFSFHNLKRIKNDYANSFEISDDNLIYLYPLHDGMSTRAFGFYKKEKLIFNNIRDYSQISNLDDILLKIVKVFDEALDKRILLDPYYFMLELTDDIVEDYHGRANLVITEKAIRNQKLDNHNFDIASKYYINYFLDRFIGRNFGVPINRNKELKKELEKLNDKVIDMGIREWAGSGFEVYGVQYEENNGLKQYKLPTEKAKVKQKRRKEV